MRNILITDLKEKIYVPVVVIQHDICESTVHCGGVVGSASFFKNIEDAQRWVEEKTSQNKTTYKIIEYEKVTMDKQILKVKKDVDMGKKKKATKDIKKLLVMDKKQDRMIEHCEKKK